MSKKWLSLFVFVLSSVMVNAQNQSWIKPKTVKLISSDKEIASTQFEEGELNQVVSNNISIISYWSADIILSLDYLKPQIDISKGCEDGKFTSWNYNEYQSYKCSTEAGFWYRMETYLTGNLNQLVEVEEFTGLLCEVGGGPVYNRFKITYDENNKIKTIRHFTKSEMDEGTGYLSFTYFGSISMYYDEQGRLDKVTYHINENLKKQVTYQYKETSSNQLDEVMIQVYNDKKAPTTYQYIFEY